MSNVTLVAELLGADYTREVAGINEKFRVPARSGRNRELEGRGAPYQGVTFTVRNESAVCSMPDPPIGMFSSPRRRSR